MKGNWQTQKQIKSLSSKKKASLQNKVLRGLVKALLLQGGKESFSLTRKIKPRKKILLSAILPANCSIKTNSFGTKLV